MPAQKRSFPENLNDGEEEIEDLPPLPRQQNGHHQYPKQSRLHSPPLGEEKQEEEEEEEEEDGEEDEGEDEEETDKEVEDEEEAGQKEDEVEEEEKVKEKQEEEDSEGSQSSSSEDEKPEFVYVELPDIRKDVQCPICLGIIKKTRTVMECLHRFCRGCIDKSMRLGNNECPACRTHCASRRSLRDDPNYDALIAALYPDIDKYEEEELAFHEEEMTRNKQIQASIAQIFQRQTEALAKRRTMGKEPTVSLVSRSQRNYRTIHSRRRQNSQSPEFQGSEDNEEENDDNVDKYSSSTDEPSTEVRHRMHKRWPGTRPSQPSSSATNPEGGCIGNDSEAGRENRGISSGLAWNTEMLAWGRGGTRSHTRHGNISGCNNKCSRSTRLSKLVEYLRSFEEKRDELDVHLMLISVEKQSTPSLQQPYLCCRPSLSVKHLRKYVAHQTSLPDEEVEILLPKGQYNPSDNHLVPQLPMPVNELQILEGQETLAGLKANCPSSRDRLILAYQKKGTTSYS